MKIETGMLEGLIALTSQVVADDTLPVVFHDVLMNEKLVKQEVDDTDIPDQPTINPAPDMSLCYINTLLAMQSGMPAQPHDDMTVSKPVEELTPVTSDLPRELSEPALNDHINLQEWTGKGLTPQAVQPQASISLYQDDSMTFAGREHERAIPTAVQPQASIPVVQDDSMMLAGREHERAIPMAVQPQERIPAVQDETRQLRNVVNELTPPAPIQKQGIPSVLSDEPLQIPASVPVLRQDMLRVVEDRNQTIPALENERPQLTAIQNQLLHRLSQDNEPVPANLSTEDVSPLPADLTKWIHRAVDSARQQDTPVKSLRQSGDELNSIQTIDKPSLQRHQPESLPAVETMISNVTDFFNKKLESSGQNNLKALIDVPAELYQPVDRSEALSSFKYNSGSLVRSLSVDGYHARISLHPADLGQITADIQVNNGTTELRLSTETAQVRQFIESHLQSLRESFQTMNIQLGDVQVQEHTSQNYPGDAQKKQDDARHSAYRQDTPARQEQQSNPRRSNAMVDTYA